MEGLSEAEMILRHLQVFAPDAAWTESQIREWLDDPSSMDSGLGKSLLGERIQKHYDTRATTLKEVHPLGIQVHLETGVANGVLVARTIEECAELIFRIVTNRLEFDLESKSVDGNRYLTLTERSTGTVFRVVTGDKFLTNSFWNFYLSR